MYESYSQVVKYRHFALVAGPTYQPKIVQIAPLNLLNYKKTVKNMVALKCKTRYNNYKMKQQFIKK